VAACTPTPGANDLLSWLPDRGCVTPLPGRLTVADLDSLVERVGGTCWKVLERCQEPGAHALLVPDDTRHRQVAARLSSAGVAEVTSRFGELLTFEGPEAEVLAPFLR
jgi:hypothetical protein